MKKALVVIVGLLIALGFAFPGFWAVAGLIILIPVFLFVTPILISIFATIWPVLIIVGGIIAFVSSCGH